MMALFASPDTLRDLADPRAERVVLLGGFVGAWNFGDLQQLLGTMRWHRQRGVQRIHPVLFVERVAAVGGLERTLEVLAGSSVLFFAPSYAPLEVQQEQAKALGLHGLEQGIRGRTTLHFYGSGALHSFWGRTFVEAAEEILAAAVPDHYLLSGEQVGPEFASELGAHLRRYRPELVGCRDPLGVEALTAQGCPATLSGDDAFEPMRDLAGRASDAGGESPTTRPAFALHLNSDAYVFAEDDAGRRANQGAERLFAELDAWWPQLARERRGDAPVLLVQAYSGRPPEVQDTLTTLGRTRFSEFFPRTAVIDVIDLLQAGRLAEAARELRRCPFLVTTSHHVAMLGRMLDVPVHMPALNDFYRQKKRVFGEGDESLAEFLRTDPDLWRQSNRRRLAAHREVRQRWWEALATALGTPVPDAVRLARAESALDHLRRRVAQTAVTESRLRGELAAARSQLPARVSRLLTRARSFAGRRLRRNRLPPPAGSG